MNIPLPTSRHVVRVKPGAVDRIRDGHPWVFQVALQGIVKGVEDGAWVDIQDHKGRFLGTGFYNSKSRIVLRVLSTESHQSDADFFQKRIAAAIGHRQEVYPGRSCFRVLNAESDWMSGLIVDKYEDVLVMQISSTGMEQRKDQIAGALRAALKPRAIIERGDGASRKLDGLPESRGVLFGEAPGKIAAHINELIFEVDPLGGHKTGAYLDQQLNYQAITRWAKGARVLDCFTFHGGFALHAAKAGAAHVTAIEQSSDAVQIATRNAAANSLSKQCEFVTDNVFDWFKPATAKAAQSESGLYDLVILDPPSFTRSRTEVEDALRGYKEIHLRAMRLLRPGGVLATFCCSHHVSRELFMSVITDAAMDSHRALRLLENFSQSPDHPILPAIPETEYLKGFALQVLPRA